MFIWAACCPAIVSQSHASVIVADSINESYSPDTRNFGLDGIGWMYTPSISYALVGIETKFSSADSRTVTMEIYDEHPFHNGGTLLRTATFTPASNAFAGGFFASLNLVSGEDYFIGFRNVQGLGYNFASDSGTEQLPAWTHRPADGEWDTVAGQIEFRSPILQFYTELNTVPEPGSIVVFGLISSFAACTGVSWRRRRYTPK
jgi:hypothetical protein